MVRSKSKRTHDIPKAEAMRRLETGETKLEPVLIEARRRDHPRRARLASRNAESHFGAEADGGDRIGYSRAWLLRPEVSIRVPRAALETLSDRARRLLRTNPIVDVLEDEDEDVYQAFAYWVPSRGETAQRVANAA